MIFYSIYQLHLPIILFLMGSPFQYIKSYLFNIGNWFFFITLLKYINLVLHYWKTHLFIILLQFYYLLTNILFIEIRFFSIKSYWKSRFFFKALQLWANDWVILLPISILFNSLHNYKKASSIYIKL